MRSPGLSITETLEQAHASLREAFDALATDDKEGLSYGFSAAITGFDRLRVAARRYQATDEARERADGHSAPMPVICDARFRGALDALRTLLEKAQPVFGTGARRLASTLADWLETRVPTCAAQVGAQADALRHYFSRKSR